jgi:hypothetical protein
MAAHQYGRKDARFGAMTAIAREDQRKAMKLEDEADILRAAKVTDLLDLHGMRVSRALRIVHFAIQEIRSK